MDKKLLKARAKEAKKRAKAEVKRARAGAVAAPPSEATPSPALRFAQAVRGVLYLVLGVSLLVALALGQRGAILSLDDIIRNLFAATAGKVVLAVIGLAMLIYGLKQLRLVK